MVDNEIETTETNRLGQAARQTNKQQTGERIEKDGKKNRKNFQPAVDVPPQWGELGWVGLLGYVASYVIFPFPSLGLPPGPDKYSSFPRNWCRLVVYLDLCIYDMTAL